jgi:hypothetical protein
MNSRLTHLLPADVYEHLLERLRETLPPPPTNSAEDLARRDEAAIARILELSPANAAEASLATLYILVFEHGKECLRLAEQPGMSPRLAMQNRRLADSMMRQAQKMLGTLRKMQAFRRKRDADPEARERAAQTERTVLALLTQALSEQPAPAAPVKASPVPAPPQVQQKPKPAEQARLDLRTIDPRKTTLKRDSKGRFLIIMPEQPGIH